MTFEPKVLLNWQFGVFEVERRTAELRRSGAAVKLQEQPAQVLVYLLEHAGQIVTRNELRQRLWPADTFVDFDHALNTAVMKLREALGDSSDRPLYIQTIPRKGYRFIAPVVEVPRAADTDARDPTMEPSLTSDDGQQNPRAGDALGAGSPGLGRKPERQNGDALMEANCISALPPSTRGQAGRTVPWTGRVLWASAALTLVGVGWFFLVHTQKTATGPARPLTRITFDEGLQTDPTWSPDGRFLAYSSDRGGNTNIWVQQISGGDPIQITHGSGANWEPDWSPDGRYIVYRSEDGGGHIDIIPALGGTGQEQKVSNFGYLPRWSPDSSQILFQSVPRISQVARTFHVARLDGSPPREILTDFFRKHRNLRPISAAWHPDGKRVTVWVGDSSQGGPSPHFWTITLEGGQAESSELTPQLKQRLLALAPAGDTEWRDDAKFVWSPAADALYLERTFRGVRSLWRLDIDPGTLKATGIERLTTGSGLDTGPSISPDGKRLAFTATSNSIRAWLYPLDANRGALTGVGKPVTSAGMEAWLVAVTRDGARLAFLGNRAGETRLWVKSLPDGREIPLFADSFLRDSPQWSPDGEHLVYERDRRDGDVGQLMLWSARTGQEEPLTSLAPPITGVFDWSLDGRWILTTEQDSGEHPGHASIATYERRGVAVWQLPVSKAPAAESDARKIVADPDYELYQAHLSPDGEWVLFEAVRGSPEGPVGGLESSIYVRRASGGPWVQIVNDEHWADKPRWSPDGKIIYFLWNRGSFFNVWGIHFDPRTGKSAGQPFRVTALDSPDLLIPGQLARSEIAVSSKNLILTQVQCSGSIWILGDVDR